MVQIPTKILLVEDDQVDQMGFKRLVKSENLSYLYTIADSVLEARDILSRRQFDIVVSDYLLGDGTAFDIFDAAGDTPFVLITGSGNELVAVQAMKKGVYDYLIKDPNQNYLQILPLTIEKALKHKNTEDTLRLIQFERNVAGVFRLDLADGRLLNCNDSFAHILGFTDRVEVLAKPDWYFYFNEEDRDKFLKQLQQEKFLINYELRLQHQNGQSTHTLTNAGLLEDPENGLKIIEGSLIDITERKRAEEVLRQDHAELERQVKARTAELSKINAELKQQIDERKQAEEALTREHNLLRTILDTALDFIYVKDTEGRFLIINPAHVRSLGKSAADDIIGKTGTEIYPPEVAARFGADDRAVIQTGRPLIDKDEMRLNQAGEPIWLRTTKVPLRDTEGTIVGIVGITRDITERRQAEEALQKAHDELERRVAERTAELRAANDMLRQEIAERQQAEEALRESEERYRGIFEAAPTSIILVDREGQIVDVNPYHVAEVSKGRVTREDFLRKEIMTRPSVVNAGLSETYKKVLEGQPVNLNEVYFPTTTGATDAFFNIKGVPLVKDGQVIGAVMMHEDITEHKKLEAQLLQSQKMEAVGSLAGGIAHDFNNILTVINGYSELLLQRHLDDHDPQRKDVEQIKKAALRAASLTRQLLAFSRKQIFQSQVLNLNTIVVDTDNMLRRLIGENIEMITDLDPGLGSVKVDPGQIEQVIMNLAINARDAMPQGGKLFIKTVNTELDQAYARQDATVQPGPYILLTLSDTGGGMDAETQARIFEPFFTTKEQGKGTGLGLATVYGIIKQSEGHIRVYSEPGQGTTFKIYLPEVERAADVAKPRAAPVELSPGSETILLVEDESMVRNLACRILQRNGYTVLEAQEGSDALRQGIEHKGPIHLLLTDVVMPGGMSGPDLAERLVPLHPTLKVLYMSGYTDDAITHHGVLEPGTAFLEKPFTPTILASKVRQILDTSH